MKKEMKIIIGVLGVLIIVGLIGVVVAETLVSDAGVSYDSEILGALNSSEWVSIFMKLNNMSEADSLLSTFLETEFKFKRKSSTRIVGEITREGFDKLINDTRINVVYFNALAHATLDESVPLINVTVVWNNLNYTGNGTKICVIDTGVNASHPALSGKIIDEYYCW